MAKLIYHVPLPNGKIADKITPDYVIHTYAVVGLLKLKRLLPPLNPDNKDEEPRWHRHQDWVLCNTCTTLARAEDLAANPVFKEATLETRIVPIVGEPFVGRRPGAAPGEDEDDEASAPQGVTVRDADTGQVMAVLPLSVKEIRVDPGLIDSLKQIPLEESNYVLPVKGDDGAVHPVLLEGVTFVSQTITAVEEPIPDDDLDVIDVEDL